MGIYQIIAQTDDGFPTPATARRFAPSETDALEAALADMTAAFSSDFSDGRVGQRYNTYEHRSRVLRQMTESLATMRAQDAMTPS
jgi:hypothetical protein